MCSMCLCVRKKHQFDHVIIYSLLNTKFYEIVNCAIEMIPPRGFGNIPLSIKL